MATSLNGANNDGANNDGANAGTDSGGIDTIGAVLRRQAGVVSRAQALSAGTTAREIDRLVARRRWVPLLPRVYLAAEHRLTDEVRVLAAVMWAGDDAVLGGLAALWWYGLLPGPPPAVALMVPLRRRGQRPGIVVSRRVFRAGDVVTVRDLAVPVRPLALLDGAVEAGSGGPALLRALRAQVDVDVAALRAAAERAAGPITARRLLDEIAPAPVDPSAAVASAGHGPRARLAGCGDGAPSR
jgi:hypothetical protein